MPDLRAVAEARPRPRHRRRPSLARRREQRLPGEGAEGDDDPQAAAAAARPRRPATARRCPAPRASARWPAARSAPRATIRVPISRCPSPARVLVGRAASPTRCSAANSQSPLRSPVKIRPVRLPPWAAGARPTTRTRGAASPQPAIGRPQYGSAANDLRFGRRRPARATAPAAGRPGRPRRLRRASGSVDRGAGQPAYVVGRRRDRGAPVGGVARPPGARRHRTTHRAQRRLREQVDRAPPGRVRVLLVVDLGACVVEERVRRPGVVVDLDVSAGLLDAADRGLDAVGLARCRPPRRRGSSRSCSCSCPTSATSSSHGSAG